MRLPLTYGLGLITTRRYTTFTTRFCPVDCRSSAFRLLFVVYAILPQFTVTGSFRSHSDSPVTVRCVYRPTLPAIPTPRFT